MYITILGRQPELGIAELERKYGNTSQLSPQSALFNTPQLAIDELGGTLKAGRVIWQGKAPTWQSLSAEIISHCLRNWSTFQGKLTVGISAYDCSASARDVQKIGIILKSQLKKRGVSMRLIPNTEPCLGTATSHHNKLGHSPNKQELIIVRGYDATYTVALGVGTQNITAYTRRDQERPKRDAFVGMLPPKLAQIMINLAAGQLRPESRILLDPFCGTGVLLQEAALMGFRPYGTDLSDTMIDYTAQNLEWLQTKYPHIPAPLVHSGDAMVTQWQQPVHVVACEAYLGQPFSAPPSPAKLQQVVGNCNHIISSFLTNIAPQLTPDTPLCVAVPAWRAKDGTFTRLPLVMRLKQLGYTPIVPSSQPLIYSRENQVVGRDLLVLRRT